MSEKTNNDNIIYIAKKIGQVRDLETSITQASQQIHKHYVESEIAFLKKLKNHIVNIDYKSHNLIDKRLDFLKGGRDK